jgi:hypothetical protein
MGSPLHGDQPAFVSTGHLPGAALVQALVDEALCLRHLAARAIHVPALSAIGRTRAALRAPDGFSPCLPPTGSRCQSSARSPRSRCCGPRRDGSRRRQRVPIASLRRST